MAASAKLVNPNAEIVAKQQCLSVNVSIARSLQSVMKSNLGPHGTLKMLVGGAGQIKLTKDGNVLLQEMQIQHPTASLLARAATAQDDVTGDGTTSNVLFCAELLKQAELHISEGLHPRLIVDGFEIAREMTLQVLEQMRCSFPDAIHDRQLLLSVAQTSLLTKLPSEVASKLSSAVVDAVQTIARPNQPIDLHMVEIMSMTHMRGIDSRFVNGLVLDHGSRHPDMPTDIRNCFILTCNISFEYEKSEYAAGFVFKNAQERTALIDSERKFTDAKVKAVIDLKRAVCADGQGFVVVNQKGIDPLSLDSFAKEGILALRRAKRRNMERICLACGGSCVNAVEGLGRDVLGFCNHVHEVTLGDDKFTFLEDPVPTSSNASNQQGSCTILIRGPNDWTIAQIKDAVRDGLRSVTNVFCEDNTVIPGAGAFELAAYTSLMNRRRAVSGKARIGLEAFAKALLIIPRTLAENSGLDVQQAMVDLINAAEEEGGWVDAGNSGENKTGMQDGHHVMVGLDLKNGKTCVPAALGIWDNYSVKRQFIALSTVLASQLLLVDEVMKAGRQMGKKIDTNADVDETAGDME